MISSETPNKLREIIQDTFPNLFRPSKDWHPPSKYYSQTNTENEVEELKD